MREKFENKEMQKRTLEDAIQMYHGFMPDSYKSVQSKIISNFHKQKTRNTTHMWNHGSEMSSLFHQPQTTRKAYGIANTIDLTGSQDHVNAMEAIPNFIALMNSFSDNVAHQNTTGMDSANEKISRTKKK